MGFAKMSFRSHGGGHNRGPLRKVVGIKEVLPDCFHELLECGHTKPVRTDFVGPTNAARRRCGKCKSVAQAGGSDEGRVG